VTEIRVVAEARQNQFFGAAHRTSASAMRSEPLPATQELGESRRGKEGPPEA